MGPPQGTMHAYTLSDQKRIEMYAYAYGWKARRASTVDLFTELGKAVASQK